MQSRQNNHALAWQTGKSVETPAISSHSLTLANKPDVASLLRKPPKKGLLNWAKAGVASGSLDSLLGLRVSTAAIINGTPQTVIELIATADEGVEAVVEGGQRDSVRGMESRFGENKTKQRRSRRQAKANMATQVHRFGENLTLPEQQYLVWELNRQIELLQGFELQSDLFPLPEFPKIVNRDPAVDSDQPEPHRF
mmetsp:Transcript_8531/g.16329  ORF Transcript_8531/g.16329 Transcript_8531/m.16329 type:complete len:196 (-) Transcript_8531:48-635(-)